MWNWHWQDAADYGIRYDFGLIEVHKICIRDWINHNQHQPAVCWLASLLLTYRDMAKELPDDIIMLGQEVWLREPQRKFWGMGETGVWQLTRGGVAACWAIDSAREGDTLTLVGFDVIKAGIAAPVEEAFSPEYMNSGGFFGMGSYKPGRTKEGNHDYPAERSLLEFKAARKAVTLQFAQDAWQ
jgi:hypothetical protein